MFRLSYRECLKSEHVRTHRFLRKKLRELEFYGTDETFDFRQLGLFGPNCLKSERSDFSHSGNCLKSERSDFRQLVPNPQMTEIQTFEFQTIGTKSPND